jgi:hypothetical protein
VLGLDEEIACALEVRDFRTRYRRSFEAWRTGDRAAAFPFGTYQMRVLHRGSADSVPLPDAIVAMPGPSLADVMAELGRGPVTRDEVFADTASLLDEVRDAFAEEADEIVVHDTLSLDDDPPPASVDSDEGDKRSVIVVRHRFSRRSDEEPARRVVVLRDRRRGRPRHGNDPPE